MTRPQGEDGSTREAHARASAETLCRLAGVSLATYHRQLRQKEPRVEETDVRDLIQRLALENRRYGYRRITALVRRAGWPLNRKRVARIMRDDNLLALRTKAWRPATTESRHSYPIRPNLARKLVPTAPDQLWVADITYVRLAEAFVYLAVVLDVWSRKVVGWAMADHLGASLAIDALDRALAVRPIEPGLVHHSDRGVQYACTDYTTRLAWVDAQVSMSRPGCPYDNAKAESFMKTLKTEEVDGSTYRDLADAKARIGEFIEKVYNRQRLHSALRYLSPEEFEHRRDSLTNESPDAGAALVAV